MTKLISLTLSFLFLLTLQTQAQDWNETTFEGGVYQSSFDYTTFDRIVKVGDKAYLYFNTERAGAIKSKGIMGSKADKLEDLTGLLEVVLLSNGDVEKTTHRFFEHETVLATKGLIYLARVPENFTDSPRILAKEGDIIEGTEESVKAIFPNYFEVKKSESTKVKAEKLAMYYENKLKYKGMRREVSAFLQRTYKLKAEEEKSKIGKFLLNGGMDYASERNEIAIEDYRGMGKGKEFRWIGTAGSTDDKITGNVYNVHQKTIKKGKWLSYQEYEFVAFDKEGKLINRIDKKYEIPTVANGSFTLNKMNEDGSATTDKKVYIMRDYNMMGMGVKKEFGDRIKLNRRHIIQTDAQGVEELDITIMPEGDIAFVEAYQNAAKETVLIGKTRKPFGLQFITLNGEAKPQTYAYSLEDDLLKGFGSEEKDLSGYSWKAVRNMAWDDGKRMIVFSLSDKVVLKPVAPATKGKEVEHFKGWFYVITDGAGQPLDSYRLMREGDSMGSTGKFIYVGTFGDNLKFLIKDPVTGGAAVSVLTVSKTDYSTTKKTVGNLKRATYLLEDGMFYLVGEQIPNLDIAPEDRKVIYTLVTSKF